LIRPFARRAYSARMAPDSIHLRLADARRHLQDGDLLLFRGRGLIARFIRTAGRSSYTHAAMVAWCHGLCMCLEMREFRGGRAVTLESQVRRFPGRIDLYSVRRVFQASYDRLGATRAMMLQCGEQYSYAGILSAAMAHLPVVRLLCKPDTDDANDPGGLPAFCSQAVANAARLGGGIDPVPNASDQITEPGDLARSQLWVYRGTLVE